MGAHEQARILRAPQVGEFLDRQEPDGLVERARGGIVRIAARGRERLHRQELRGLRGGEPRGGSNQNAADPVATPSGLDAHDIDFGGGGRVGFHRNEPNCATSGVETCQHRQVIGGRDVGLDRLGDADQSAGIRAPPGKGTVAVEDGDRLNSGARGHGVTHARRLIRRISFRVRSRHLHTAGGHHGLGCAPTGRRRRISSIEVGKIEFGMTVHALLDFPESLQDRSRYRKKSSLG